MKKRMIGLLLVICLVLALLPVGALAAEPSGTTEDGLSWSIADGTLTIRGTGPMQDYDQRSIMGDGVRITTNAPWFEYADSITAVVVESGVTKIGDWAFSHLDKLDSVSIAESVQSVGLCAFSSCLALKTVTLPSHLDSIGKEAFSSCQALERINMPKTVGTIGDTAFIHCESLKAISLPQGLEKIGTATFSSCFRMTRVDIPASVKQIAEDAFFACNSLTDVYFGGTEAEWNAILPRSDEPYNQALKNATVHFNTTDPLDRFTDIPDYWARDAIAYCVQNDLMNGTSDTTFDPTFPLTRAMVVTVLWRMCDKPEATQSTSFQDLTQEWYRPAVAWAQEKGIVNGVDENLFAPDLSITRQDFVTILCRMLNAMGATIYVSELTAFSDAAEVSDYAKTPMQWAVAEGILTGAVDNQGMSWLSPKANTARDQAAAIFMRFCELEIELPDSAN